MQAVLHVALVSGGEIPTSFTRLVSVTHLSLFPHFHPTLHVLRALLKLPGLAGALVEAGAPPPGVGGARKVRFSLFFFLPCFCFNGCFSSEVRSRYVLT
jgi:hypothetical protein